MKSYAASLHERLSRVRETMESAARQAGRSGGDVRIVAVTKGHSVESIRAAVEAGLNDIGENRVGELEEKAAQLPGSDIRWHMVGHVQRRKVPRVLPLMGLLHSLDSVRLARRLDDVAGRRVGGAGEGAGGDAEGGAGSDGRRVCALIQVNTSGEASKYGLAPEEFPEALEKILALPRVRVDGLMTMAPYDAEEPVLRGTFAGLRRLHEEALSGTAYRGSELSMGMSNDYGIAVEEGSTMIRIGTALFGARDGQR